MDGFTDNFLNLVTATGFFDIGGKGPLTYAPVLNGTGSKRRCCSCIFVVVVVVMTGHVGTRTPVGLPRHLTKVFLSGGSRSGIGNSNGTLQIDTNAMGTNVVIPIDTGTGSSVTRQGHALGRTWLQVLSIDVAVSINHAAEYSAKVKEEERQR